MGKFNLTDAAKAILTEGAKETFDSNIASKKSGQDGPQKLPTSVAYGTKDAGEVADVVDKKDDDKPDYTKGAPTATPPGATPPVGAQPGAKLSGPAETQGSEHAVSQAEPTSYENIRDRVKAKLAQQTFHANPGATFQSYAEEKVEDESVVSEEKDEGHEDAAEDKKMIKAMLKKQKMKEDMDADVSALLSGEELSEDFKEKASTIFEAAVIARTQAMMEEVEEALFEEFELAVEEVKNDLSAKLDDYIGYMAEEWVKENTLAIEKGLRAEIVEEFIAGLKNLFVEHYIDIPEEKVDVVEELTNKVEELEAQINEEIQSAVELRKELNEHKKNEAIHAVCEGLTQTQVEKMKSLAESVEFTTDEEFADKLVTLRTSYFTEAVKAADSSALNEEVQIEEDKPEVKTTASADPLINAAASAISKSVVK
jgi:hypothetical protein